VLLDEAAYDQSGLLAIQRAAAELAAARADLVSILHMPQHYRTRAALDYQRALGTALRQAGSSTASFAALYHPWLVQRSEDGALAALSPDGAVCGIIAARTLARGAWVPPANQAVREALALTPTVSDDDHEQMYAASINLMYNSVRGFVVWGANTLDDDPHLGLLNVRRLLILLRRLVLRDGQRYVFAPHSPAFRRRVALGLERQLDDLFRRGAFAGGDPAQAYRVTIDETVNTSASIAQGQFIVELRIAPAQPLTFITVRLIQTENNVLSVEEVA
jgi:phage tail sheath protein FI